MDGPDLDRGQADAASPGAEPEVVIANRLEAADPASRPTFRRVLLKLSGDAFAPADRTFGISGRPPTSWPAS